MQTVVEMLREQRVRQDLLWIPPYDGLKLWTRLWRHAHTQLMALRRYEQSPTLALVKKRLSDEIEAVRSSALLMYGMAEEQIERTVAELPEWCEWAKHVPGVGKISLGKLLGLTGNPAARELFSSYARHCGVAVINGRIEKPQRGHHRPYNALAKSQLWLIVSCVLRAYPKSPNLYGEIYYLSREKFRNKHPDWTDMHVHLASVLRTARLFLSHLWEVSRRTQGLPVREPYPMEYFGHVVKIPFSMALHPIKYRSEVAEAIHAVERWLPDERDEEVRQETEQLLQRMREHIKA